MRRRGVCSFLASGLLMSDFRTAPGIVTRMGGDSPLIFLGGRLRALPYPGLDPGKADA
jgi:hypothetical protein